MVDAIEPKSCGVLLICGDPVSSFLLMKHHDRWDLPKGHIDPGESETECALREMQEETGIPPEAVRLDPGFRFTQEYDVPSRRYGNGDKKVRKTLVVFLGRVDREWPINCTEHAGCRWFPWSPPHRIQERTIDPLLKQVEEYLGGSHRGSNSRPSPPPKEG